MPNLREQIPLNPKRSTLNPTPHERDHPGRRLRHKALPDYQSGIQTADAGVRQADDLLSAVHPDDGGDK